jgi:hypothetical protein
MQAQRARRVKDLAVKLEIIELVFTREVPDQKLAGEIVMEHLESVVHALVDRGAAMLPRESEDIEAVMHLDKLVLQRRHLLNHRQRRVQLVVATLEHPLLHLPRRSGFRVRVRGSGLRGRVEEFDITRLDHALFGWQASCLALPFFR